MNKIVEFKKARLGYGAKSVFRELDFSIFEGDFFGIVGPNGSGKTTLLRSIMGLLKPKSGEIKREGALRFGYCKQRQFVDTLFPFTVMEIVMMSRTSRIKRFRGPTCIDRERCAEAIETAGIPELASERFYNLSGGQKQKVLIARALAMEPCFLVLDEPTTDLDIKAEKEILGLIKKLHEETKITIALVSHEFNEFINLADKFIFLKESFLNKVYRREDLTEELLSEIFDTNIKLEEIDGQKFIV